MVNPPQEPTVGDRVWVPWGLENVEGEIIDVYVSPPGRRARVRLVGHEHESIVTVPLDTLVRIDALPSDGPLGSARKYEQLLRTALTAILEELDPSIEMKDPPDRGVDLMVRSKNRTVLIQVKYYSTDVKVSSDAVLAATGLTNPRVSVLLITNVTLTKEARQRMDSLHRHGTSIWHVLWRSYHDNEQLARAIKRALVRYVR